MTEPEGSMPEYVPPLPSRPYRDTLDIETDQDDMNLAHATARATFSSERWTSRPEYIPPLPPLQRGSIVTDLELKILAPAAARATFSSEFWTS